jgi:hypothetical protein
MMVVQMTMMYVDLHRIENVYRGRIDVNLRFLSVPKMTEKHPQISARCKRCESSSKVVDGRIRLVFGCLSEYSPSREFNMAVEAHHKAAEHRQKAAEHHHKAAAHHEAGNHEKAHEHATKAHEHATEAHKHSAEAHEKSAAHA